MATTSGGVLLLRCILVADFTIFPRKECQNWLCSPALRDLIFLQTRHLKTPLVSFIFFGCQNISTHMYSRLLSVSFMSLITRAWGKHNVLGVSGALLLEHEYIYAKRGNGVSEGWAAAEYPCLPPPSPSPPPPLSPFSCANSQSSTGNANKTIDWALAQLQINLWMIKFMLKRLLILSVKR